MTVNYTTNLSLGQPVTGTQSGTWGDDVNNSVTAYLDIAVAGGLSVPITTADVTLANTSGTSASTGITSTTAQYAILNISGAKTAARNLNLPISSKWYIINNSAATGGYALTVRGVTPTTGITLVDGEKAVVAWNGTDYVKIASSVLTNFTGILPVANGGTGLATTPANGELDIGNGTGFTRTTLTAGTGVTITNASGAITINATGTGGTVTSVTGTSPVSVATGTTTPVISLAASYGDTQNPYASKTANFVLAAPNGTAGVPTFRAIVAADIPTLNQNTTGTAGGLSATLGTASGGTGSTTAQGAINILAGSVTSGSYLRGNGTNVTMSTIQAADVPTLNQNTTGTAAGLSAVLAIASGGTNSTATPTNGGIGYGTGTAHAYTSAGTAGQVVVSAGAAAPAFGVGAATTPSAVTFSATAMTVNCALSNVFTTTFTANVTTAPTLSNPIDGQTINWFITQDATGSRTITWPTSFKWSGGLVPVLSTTANSVDLLVATYRSATSAWYATLTKAFS